MILAAIPEDGEIIIEEKLFNTLTYNTNMYYIELIRNAGSRRIATFHLDEYKHTLWEINCVRDRYHREYDNRSYLEMLQQIIDEKFPLENEPSVPDEDEIEKMITSDEIPF